MNMKKFVGLVNGKSFDNEKDFNEAVQEVIKSDNENLSISSYYKYTNDEEKKEISKADNNYVSLNECFLGERKPDKVNIIDPAAVGCSGYTNVEYNLKPEVEERLKVASNKKNIKESINFHVTKLVDNIKTAKDDLTGTEKQIEILQKELEEKQNRLLDLEGRRKYYNHILDIVETPDEVEKKVNKVAANLSEKKDEKKDVPQVNSKENNDIRKLLNIDENTSFFDLLKQLGILK